MNEIPGIKIPDEHFAAYAAITDPTERGKYYDKHLASALTAKPSVEQAASEKTAQELADEYACITDPVARGAFFRKHEQAIMSREISKL